MIDDHSFPSTTQTPPQAHAHDRMSKREVPAKPPGQVSTQHLYHRYLAGELRWEQVRSFQDAI